MSIWPWLIVLLAVVLTLGTSMLGHLGSELGQAVKGKTIIDVDVNEKGK